MTIVAAKDLPAFCRVAAVTRPSADSEIKFEVWMPASNWNGKFIGVGNGGMAGSISYASTAATLSRGHAASSTDTGHEGRNNDGSYALGHREKVIDFGYRGVHEMTLEAKLIIAAHYGRAPAFSYWSGCSTGGRQALTEAQRFPADYNGIIAGAPPIPHPLTSVKRLEVSRIYKNPGGRIPPSKLPLIHGRWWRLAMLETASKMACCRIRGSGLRPEDPGVSGGGRSGLPGCSAGGRGQDLLWPDGDPARRRRSIQDWL